MDESQNTTVDQMKMFLTRMGFGSYAVINGDMTQIDLPKNIESGLSHALKVLEKIEDIGFTIFNSRDVVRHPLVRKLLMHTINLINKKLSLNILTHDFREISSELVLKLDLLTEHILIDQNQDQLTVNLKLISSKEMIKLNRDFRSKALDTNVLSFPSGKDIQKISGELGDIAMSLPSYKVSHRT